MIIFFSLAVPCCSKVQKTIAKWNHMGNSFNLAWGKSYCTLSFVLNECIVLWFSTFILLFVTNNVNCLRRQLFLKKLHTKSCFEFYSSMRYWNAMLLLKEITQESRILFMCCFLVIGLLENFIILITNLLIVKSCKLVFKIMCALGNISIIWKGFCLVHSYYGWW